MNKAILGVCLGLLVGAGAMYLLNHRENGTPAAPAAAEPAKPAEAAAPEPGTVHLETDEQEKADLQTAQPAPMDYRPETKGYAHVLDPSSLVSDLGDVTAAGAALDASAKELARLQSLAPGGNASAQAVEAATAAVQHDQAQLTAARAKLVSDWGPDLAGYDQLSQLTVTLLAREAALVRIDVPGGEKLPPAPLAVQLVPMVGTGNPVSVDLLGPAPNVDPQAQGAAFLALLNGRPTPPVDTMLIALITGSDQPQKGFHLPGAAIVRYAGDTYVYAQTNAEDFERWKVVIGAELRDGSVFITNGVTAQDHIVVQGAAQLLSEELKAATGGPD